jgi:hypothetical protein
MRRRIPGAPPPMLHDIVLRRTIRDGRVRVQPLPPDELLIDRRAVSLDEAPFVAHRVKRTISELIEMGYPTAKVIDLAGDDTADYSLERLERFQDEDEMPWRDDATLDPTMREVWITECYIRVDYDGERIAELRKVTVAGDGAATSSTTRRSTTIPFAVLWAFQPAVADRMATGLNHWLMALPDGLWQLFGLGYLGYTGGRTFEKWKGVAAK